MRKAAFVLAFCATMLLPAFGQVDLSHKIDNEYVQRQFGKDFTIVPEIAPVFGDLDGDGVEDVVIAARCKNPLPDQAQYNYTVVDPYYDFYGYGNPTITTRFSEPDPALRGLMVLVVHGAGSNGWRAVTPKAKFVIIHLPYRNVTVRKMKLRKKTIEAIYVEEAGETEESSAVFFDGKTFRYVPMGGSME